jgi:hypothetical protein
LDNIRKELETETEVSYYTDGSLQCHHNSNNTATSDLESTTTTAMGAAFVLKNRHDLSFKVTIKEWPSSTRAEIAADFLCATNSSCPQHS